MVMKRVYIYPFEMRISPIDSYESQLSIGAILVFRRQILMHFMGHFRIRVISTIFEFEKIVHKILSAACSKFHRHAHAARADPGAAAGAALQFHGGGFLRGTKPFLEMIK